MNQRVTKKKHILHFPKWYPQPADIQNGVFIKKHIGVTAEKFNSSVVFATSAKQNNKFEVQTSFAEGVFTVEVFFREYESKSGLKHAIHALRYLKAMCKGTKLAKQQFGKPALVHAHVVLRTALLAWILAFYHHIPFIISEHWSGFINGNFQRKNLIYRKLVIFVMRKAAKIVVVSKNLKESLVKIGIKVSKISIIPNIVDALSQAENRRFTASPGRIFFLSVADLVDRIKNISDIIKTIAELPESTDFEYWIVGDGEDKEKLVLLAESLGLLNKKVFFMGRKNNDEVLKIINEVDFLVLNSFTETFSVVTAEALLAGKPVIATRCGGPEIYVNETNGILIEPGNRVALKAVIIKMMENYKSYNPEILKNPIREKFGREAVGKEILAIYEEVFNRK
jgi:glycosyltransferase involved in cell wall biosynthesis